MKTQNRWVAAVAMVVAVAAGNALWAFEPAPTRITVESMCQGCANKITANLQVMPGVARVQCYVPQKTVIVIPQAQRVLSPRTLWEGVEKSGERPIRLEGPNGTFAAKPRF